MPAFPCHFVRIHLSFTTHEHMNEYDANAKWILREVPLPPELKIFSSSCMRGVTFRQT